MKKKELVRQLNSLRQTIKPDSQWKAENRDILVSQINAQTRLDFSAAKSRFFVKFLPKNILLPLVKPAISFAVIACFMVVAWTASVSATKNSLPGDLFYNIKLTTERVQANLTLSDEKRANLEIGFAQRRLDEIDKLMAKDDEDSNLQIPLKEFQQNMANVKTSLAKLEKKDKGTAVKVANIIDEKSKEYVVLLENQQKQSPELAVNTQEAIAVSKNTGNKALSLIIQEYEAGTSDVPVAEVSQKVKDRISDLQSALNQSKEEIDTIINNKKLAEEQAAKEAAEKEAAEKLAAEQAAAEQAAAESAEGQEGTEANSSQEPAGNEEQSAPASSETPAESNPAPADAQNPAATGTDSQQPNGQSADTASTEQPAPSQDQAQPVDDSQPQENLPSLEEAMNKRMEALTLLIDAENLLNENKISQAFELIKKADDILSVIKKVVLANSEFLNMEAPSQEPVDVPADQPALRGRPADNNSTDNQPTGSES